MGVATASFLIFAASQVGTPGPANMALLATGAAHGLRKALPFVAGVVCGKQLIIWPIGFGLMSLAQSVPWLFTLLKFASAAYICWLAWRVARMRLTPGQSGKAPGFKAGLIVHPLNPKAWAMIATGFTAFTTPGTPVLTATATIAACLFVMQCLLHPIWAGAGQAVASTVAGTRYERGLMVTLALLTVASVGWVLVPR